MSIFFYHLKRILRSKIQLFFLFAFPLSMTFLAYIGDPPEFKMTIIDRDNTELTKQLTERIARNGELVAIDEKAIDQEVMNLKTNYVLVIEKGFTDRLIQGKPGGMREYFIQESNKHLPVKMAVEQFVAHTSRLASAAGHHPERFYQGLSSYMNDGIQTKFETGYNPEKEISRDALAYLALAMLFSSMITTIFMIQNKNNGTLHRSMAAPVSLRRYTFQMVASFICVSLLQVAVVFLVFITLFDIDMGGSAAGLFCLFAVFSFVTVSFGAAISAYTKTPVQACTIAICIVPPMGMLGGVYFPTEGLSDFLKSVAKFFPTTWLIDGMQTVLDGAGFASIGKSVLMLLLFSVIFFLLGTFRKTDIAG